MSACGKQYMTDTGGYATWQVMEEYLPQATQNIYRSIFNEFDVGGSGVISIEDVAGCLSKSGMTYSTNDIRDILRNVVNDGSFQFVTNEDFVDFSEFLAIILSISMDCVSEDEMLKVFNIFDQDGDGFIGREELRDLLSKLGDEVSEKEVEEMIEEADRDGDGLVSYHEFVRIITNSCDSQTAIKECKNQTQTQSHSDLSTSICSSDESIPKCVLPPSTPYPCKRESSKMEISLLAMDQNTTRNQNTQQRISYLHDSSGRSPMPPFCPDKISNKKPNLQSGKRFQWLSKSHRRDKNKENLDITAINTHGICYTQNKKGRNSCPMIHTNSTLAMLPKHRLRVKRNSLTSFQRIKSALKIK